MKLFYICLLIFLSLNFPFSAKGSSVRQWCWTKPITPLQSKSIPSSNGGLNWGFCSSSGPGSNEKVPYRIYVETSNLNPAGSSGTFYLTLYGEENETEENLLSKSGFESGSTTIVKILARKIGDVIKIKLRNGGFFKENF